MKNRTLYLGTNPSNYEAEGEVVHLPMIEIAPRVFHSFSIKSAFADMHEYTHAIFTSKNSVPIVIKALAHFGLDASIFSNMQVIAVGKMTAKALEENGIKPDIVAEKESQEGIIHELALLDLETAYLFIPCSSKARPALSQYLQNRWIRHQMCHMYDTVAIPRQELPELKNFQKIVFTSPSTVDAFMEAYGTIPQDLEVESIGAVTLEALKGRRINATTR